MATIYHWDEPVTVSQQRYNELIALSAAGQRERGWFATSTARPIDTTNKVGGISKIDQRLAGKFPYRRPKVITHVTSMQSGHGWTASNALANGMNDNTDFALGAQSAFITSKTDTTAATLTSGTLNLDMSATRTLRLLVKVTGSDNIQGLTLYATSDAFSANYSICNVQNVVADPTVRWLKDNEWKWVTVTMASANVQTGGVTGTPNYAAINGLRFRLTTTTGTSATLRVQAVQVIERPQWAERGIVCFTYDDSYANQFAVAKLHLDKWGFPATAFTIHSNITDGNNGNGLWMTTQNLKDLRHNSRWEIGLHTETLANHSRAFAAGTNSQSGAVFGTNPLSAFELDTDITNELEWLMSNNLTDGYLGHCHPQGRFTSAVNTQLANRTAYARAMTANSNGLETVPPADPYAVRCITLDNNSNITNLKAIVDAVAQQGGMVVFCCHNIVTTPAASTEFKTADHATLVDYVAASGARVMTLGDVMRACAAQSPAPAPSSLASNSLQVGEETYPRELMTTSVGPSASGQMRMTYFTCQKTEVTTQVRVYTGGTAAGATPTLCRVGLYTVGADGVTLTLVASTPNDTTLFAAANTAYTKAWSTPYTKVAGQRYAVGPLVVTAATVPNFAGQGIGQAPEAATGPVMSTSVTGLSDLPATASSFSQSGVRPYIVLLP